MREILFRGKAINRNPYCEYRTNYQNGDWVYGLVSKLFDSYFELPDAEMTNESGVSGIEVDGETITQYTGLTDKNGVKIFEGDIIKDNEGTVYEVEYNGVDGGAFIGQRQTGISFEWLHEIDKPEIIGNVYEDQMRM